MSIYKLETLMEETRRLAADYRQSTGQTLPVSGELARFDAMRLLGLTPAIGSERGVDAILEMAAGPRKVQIKGRVIFDHDKKPPRIGQLNLDANWDITVLVVMDARYRPQRIFQLDHNALTQSLSQEKGNSRGAMSVKKFEKLAQICWQADTSESLSE